MAGSRPTAKFATVDLETATIAAGRLFARLYLGRYPDPLGFGKTQSRFSDQRRRTARNRFGVLYLGESLKVCFLETVLRDKRNGAIGDFPLSEHELHVRQYAQIAIARDTASTSE
jgi:RES domain